MLLSLKNGEPPLKSEVMPPFADMPVLLPEEPNCFAPVYSVTVTDCPGVFSFLCLLFFSLISLKFFSFWTNLS